MTTQCCRRNASVSCQACWRNGTRSSRPWSRQFYYRIKSWYTRTRVGPHTSNVVERSTRAHEQNSDRITSCRRLPSRVRVAIVSALLLAGCLFGLMARVQTAGMFNWSDGRAAPKNNNASSGDSGNGKRGVEDGCGVTVKIDTAFEAWRNRCCGSVHGRSWQFYRAELRRYSNLGWLDLGVVAARARLSDSTR